MREVCDSGNMSMSRGCAEGIIETPMRPDKLTKGLAEIRKGKQNEADDKPRNAIIPG